MADDLKDFGKLFRKHPVALIASHAAFGLICFCVGLAMFR